MFIISGLLLFTSYTQSRVHKLILCMGRKCSEKKKKITSDVLALLPHSS
jgi:hypothetical protein